MALVITSRGTGTHNTGASSFTLSPGSNCTAGALIALCVAADNSSSGGSTNDFTTVTDGLGNTWTKRQSPVFDNGAASAGVQGAIYTTSQNGGTLQTSTVITVNFGSSPVAKTWTMTEVKSDSGGQVGFRTGGNKAAGATGTAMTLGASATVNVGEVIVACFYMESGTTQSVTTPDADSTNGTWTTNQYAEIGSTTSGSCCVSQAKLQTTTNSTQSYDVTMGISSDYHGSYVILTQSYTLSVAAGSFAETGTATTLKLGRALAPGAGSFVETGTAAALTRGRTMSVSSGSFLETGTAATLKFNRVLSSAAGSFAETGTATTLKLGRRLSVAQGSFTETGSGVSLSLGRKISVGSGSFIETGTATPLLFGRRVAVVSGSFLETGTDVGLRYPRTLAVAVGSYALTGTDATLTYAGGGELPPPSPAWYHSVDRALSYSPGTHAGTFLLYPCPGTFR